MGMLGANPRPAETQQGSQSKTLALGERYSQRLRGWEDLLRQRQERGFAQSALGNGS
jgi:hypothetical protein